jgi:hypothetical protein
MKNCFGGSGDKGRSQDIGKSSIPAMEPGAQKPEEGDDEQGPDEREKQVSCLSPTPPAISGVDAQFPSARNPAEARGLLPEPSLFRQ